ncbi:hypothetical protein [Mycobacteroides salmoniphilum]|uniref:Proline rich protein n=1 Tax=Mycobacteroides salmoniphilum TaxID=404941 RepID=A0A4V3I0L4_9MYCO|nr:hypothetical protein [Mycobacteroides salmoniphilum]TEA02131.1 hypothetical protein CCUG60884_03260 [Mycobacteroides salmoniphilum]
MTTPDNPDTPTNPVSVSQAPTPAPRSASNTLLVKIAAVVGIVAGAFVILGVTFGLGVLAGSQCGHGGHGGHGGPGGHDRSHVMMFDRDDAPPVRGPVIIQRGPEIGPPDFPSAPGERRQLPPPPPPQSPSQTVPRP